MTVSNNCYGPGRPKSGRLGTKRNNESIDTTVAAFKMAAGNLPIVQPLLFHSDRGIQYACSEFTNLLKKWPVKQSMSRKGNCWDNAVAESFFKTMKTKMIYHRSFLTKSEARLAIFEYI